MRTILFPLILALVIAVSCDDQEAQSVNNANNINNANNTSNNVTCTPLPDPASPQAVALFTTDYTNGALGVISLDGTALVLENDMAMVHSDAIGRAFGATFYVVNRLGADNIATLDAVDLSVAGQFSTGPGTNPQDVVLFSSCRGFVSLYASDHLLVVNPLASPEDALVGEVDLAAFADADGAPEASFMARSDDLLLVAIQNLENYSPTRSGRIIVVDSVEASVSSVIELTTANPFTPLVEVSGTGEFLVGTVNDFSGLGGGIEIFTAQDATAALVVSSEDLGGVPSELAMVDDQCGYALVTTPDYSTGVRGFCLDGAVDEGWLLSPGELSVSGLLVFKGMLLLADTTMGAQGVRVVNLADGTVSELFPSTLPPTYTKPFAILP